jgi:aromatic ring-opening dioxygenase catalytic subunit (LigB family)
MQPDSDHDSGLKPVHFFSHGSTRMLEAETESGDHWEKCGEEALAHGVKGVILMVSIWSTDNFTSIADQFHA